MSDDRPPSDDADAADVAEGPVDSRRPDTDDSRPAETDDSRPSDTDDSRPSDIDESEPADGDDPRPSDIEDLRSSDTGDPRPVDATGDTATADDGDEQAADPSGGDRPAGRDVEVPLRVYKTVTVFSTLFAVVAVVAGFVLLDTATRRATAAPEDVDVAVALVGLGSIALGAVVYAFSTRFRARGMGKPKDEAD